jgi:hypothetical protein
MTMPFSGLFPHRRLAAGITAIIAVASAPVVRGAAPEAATTLVCTNPASHVSWPIHIDFATGTVDANPARISAGRISWRDRTDGGHYTLDRKSGDLTVVLASSTGGYSLHDHCAPGPSKPHS